MRPARLKTWGAGWFFLGILVASLVTCHADAQGPCPFNSFCKFMDESRALLAARDAR